MPTRRTNRVNDLLREELSDLIQRQVKDPRLAVIVSITEVVTSPDFKSAKVYVSTFGDATDKDQTLRGLRSAAAFLRRALKPRLAMKNVPFLTFHQDDSIEEGAHLSTLIDQVTPPPETSE